MITLRKYCPYQHSAAMWQNAYYSALMEGRAVRLIGRCAVMAGPAK